MTPRVLFVDDEADLEPLVLQKFRRQIRDGDISFVFARDGIEALEIVGSDKGVDLVITDINMPRMDGLTLLQELQEREAGLSTIIVSAYGDMSNIRTAMNRGAFDFLIKPIDFADLETTIAKTVRYDEMLREAHRRQAAAEKAFASLSRFFSPNLAESLAATGNDVALAGKWREISVLFTDIASFTGLAETLEPAQLEILLNEYLTGMTDIVFAHEGTVTKVVGDAMHILFGAPGDQPDHADRAVACALALDQQAEQFRDSWESKGILVGATRIGAHAGPAIVGNFGGERFFDYTAYGDTVNVAARLEQANKTLGTRICISASLAEQARNFEGRPIGNLALRGRSDIVSAFEALDKDQWDCPSTREYLMAYSMLEAGTPEALPAFAALVGNRSYDQLASFHLKRLLNGESGVRVELI